MARVTFSGKGRRIKKSAVQDGAKSGRSAEDVVRELRKGIQKPPGEDYRERSLAIHGLICALCGREFDHANRHLLTVHHKDGNHHYNPPDGSNWENLCIYCHENVHSRDLLGDYFEGTSEDTEDTVIYSNESAEDKDKEVSGILGKKLAIALQKKGKINTD